MQNPPAACEGKKGQEKGWSWLLAPSMLRMTWPAGWEIHRCRPSCVKASLMGMPLPAPGHDHDQQQAPGREGVDSYLFPGYKQYFCKSSPALGRPLWGWEEYQGSATLLCIPRPHGRPPPSLNLGLPGPAAEGIVVFPGWALGKARVSCCPYNVMASCAAEPQLWLTCCLDPSLGRGGVWREGSWALGSV